MFVESKKLLYSLVHVIRVWTFQPHISSIGITEDTVSSLDFCDFHLSTIDKAFG